MSNLTLDPSVKNYLGTSEYIQYKPREENEEDLLESLVQKAAYKHPKRVGKLPSSDSTPQLELNSRESGRGIMMKSAYGERRPYLTIPQAGIDLKTRIESSKADYESSSYLVDILDSDVNEDSLNSTSDTKKIEAYLDWLFSRETINKPEQKIVQDAYKHLAQVGKLSRSYSTTYEEHRPRLSKSQTESSKPDYLPENKGIANLESLYDDFEAEVGRLFSLATFIDLEPGMTNEFSAGLEDAIERYGEQALYAIEDTILNRNAKSSIAMEALQYLGYTDSTKWHDERRRTIERCLLRSPSVWVRDGAGLGLASLDDPKSIPALEEAILNETSGALKEDLTLVLHQLHDTQREP